MRVAVAFGVAWAALAATMGAQSETETAPPAIYTAVQAARGADEYAQACAHCHRSDLLGDARAEIPSLAEDDFFLRWEGRPLSRLFAMISLDMPADRPGGLTRQAYADILAYILQVNRYAAGSQELQPDSPAVAAVTIERP